MNDDFFIRTASGGVVTLVAAAIMLILFLNELRACPPRCGWPQLTAFQLNHLSPPPPGLFLHVRTEYALDVDTSRGDTIQINVRALLALPPAGTESWTHTHHHFLLTHTPSYRCCSWTSRSPTCRAACCP